MPGTRNTYIEGLDRDTSYEKFSNKKYYNARNFKVTTHRELSVGSLEVEKGNDLRFSIPNVTSSKVITEGFIPTNGYSNTTVYINGHTETGIDFDDLKSLKDKIETLFSSEINNGDLTLILDSGKLYFIGLDARDYYLDDSNPGMAINIGDENMDPGTGNNTSWGGPAPQLYPAQNDLKICGWGELRHKIVILTTDSEEKEPDSYGQIWMLEYDHVNNSIKGLGSNNKLVPSEHLIVNNKANFSLYHRAGEVIGRYENKNIGRIYWTDNYNSPRSFNLFANNTYIVKAEDMNIRANVKFSQPSIDSVGNGSLPVGSVVQYTYRLKNSDSGGITTFAPLSKPIKLSDFDPNLATYQDYSGAWEDEANSRSVTYTIPHIDTEYNTIEHILVIYENETVPQIYKFDEEFIGSLEEVQVTNSSIPSDAVEITLEEFATINDTITRTKTIDVKDNRLIMANNESKVFDVDFDARAYRFNSDQKAYLYDSTKIKQGQPDDLANPDHVIDGNSPNWNIPEDADALNPFNYDDNIWDYNTNYLHAYQPDPTYLCKYRKDGIFLGGSGPNIEYNFFTYNLDADTEDDNTTSTPLIDVSRYSDTLDHGFENSEGDPITYSINNEFRSQKSPIVESYLTGYARGEVYRFGIVFYDRQGTPSFVKWIGDIRFPLANNREHAIEGFKEHNILGINFVVNISSIKDQISGFRIMRVERKNKDITRIETGVTAPLHYLDEDNSNDFHKQLRKEFNDGSISSPRCFFLDGDTDNTNQTSRTAPWRQECIYIGSMGQFKELDDLAESADYIEFQGKTNRWTEELIASGSNFKFKNDKLPQLDVGNPDLVDPNGNKGDRIDINNAKIFGPGEVARNIPGFPYPVLNKAWTQAWYGTNGDVDDEVASSIGDRKVMFDYSLRPDDYWIDTLEVDYLYITVGRKRDKAFDQYGGDTYEDRSNQEYIIASDFQIINENVSNWFDLIVFGGDTYHYYYDFQNYTKNVDKDTSNVDIDDDPLITLGLCHTLETSINVGLSDKNDPTFTNLAKDGNVSASNTEDLFMDLGFNNVYKQGNVGRQVYLTKDIFSNIVKQHTHEIRASKKKVDGEKVDSWRFFPTAQTLEVEGTRGAINKIINFKDIIYFLQSQGLGAVSINERSTISTEQGTRLTLGFGGILDDYRYVSTISGTRHQYSVVDSGSAIFYVDAINKKIMRFGGNGNMPLSDIKGISSYLDKKIEGHIEERDQTLVDYVDSDDAFPEKARIGIHSVFDKRHNRVFITFLSGSIEEKKDPDDLKDLFKWEADNFTISYSEQIKAFESFYDFTPSLYLSHGHQLFSVDPALKGDVYEHEEGDQSTFYGTTYNSEIDIIVNEKSSIPKIFNNLQINSESYDISGNDIEDDTVDKIQVYNAYQDSGEVPLIPENNIQRRFRKWRMIIPRQNDEDSILHDPSKDSDHRIRGPWCHIRLVYDNKGNYRFILHDIETYFMEKPY